MALNPSVQNNFTGGLKTEFTGLNFPENACTQTENCVFTIIGDVLRREGFDYEANAILSNINRSNSAINTYKWNNVGGDGLTQIIVLQVGVNLFFFQSTNATLTNPLSSTRLTSTFSIFPFLSSGNTFTVTQVGQVECQFTDGNGYLFVFHPAIDSLYCTFNSVNSLVTPLVINLQVRDVFGIPEPNVADNLRPTVLTPEHQYNLTNQGWTTGSVWTATGSLNGNGSPCVGNIITLTISSQVNTTSITNGSVIKFSFQAGQVGANNGNVNLTATVQGVVNTYLTPFNTITIQVSNIDYDCTKILAGSWSGGNFFAATNQSISMSLVNVGFVTAWFTALKNYPANSDIWWLYKDTTNVFSPSTTFSNVQQNVGASPKGTYILNPFNQQRSKASSIPSLTDVVTTIRPSTGAWFQGRLFFTGINASQQATGDEPYYTWTENIYFSQTIVSGTTQFGKCYQVNDPTSQTLFDILPTDGGVITIQGAGAIYELFPIQTGLIVRAANGVYFISGGSGVAFQANDYSVSKISNIQSISSTKAVNVQGWPMFWNEEGIYYVTVRQNSSSIRSPDINLDVKNLCLGTILSFYANIPLQSKKFARGDYHPLDYIVQFCFRSTNESSVTDRYQFDSIINFNIATQAFYPYQIATATNSPYIHGINYVAGPGGSTSPAPVFKYVSSQNLVNFTFSEERDTNFIDWKTSGFPLNYISNFITGYKLPGKGIVKFQPTYVYIYSNNVNNTAYKIQGIWDYAISRDSHRWGVPQTINNFLNTLNFSKLFRKHKIRGKGLVLQFQILSVDGKPFDIMGWTVMDETQEKM